MVQGFHFPILLAVAGHVARIVGRIKCYMIFELSIINMGAVAKAFARLRGLESMSSAPCCTKPTHRPLGSFFLGLLYKILTINHKKKLLRGLWLNSRQCK